MTQVDFAVAVPSPTRSALMSRGEGVALWPPLDFRDDADGSSSVVASTTDTSPAAASAGWDVVDEWGKDSFPASDPPANW